MDNDSNNQANPQPAGGMTVMDVQAPQAGAVPVSPAPASPVTDAPVEPTVNDTITPEASADQQSTAQAAYTEPAPAVETPPTVQNPMVAAAGKHPKKRTGLVVVVAVVVALALAVAAYFAFQKNSSKPQSAAKSAATAAATVPAAKAVTTSDVDEASQSIDKSLSSTDDNKDFSSADLTDAALGL